MSEQKPTTAAMRAAEKIAPSSEKAREKLAAIIDTKTGLSELIAALQPFAEHQSSDEFFDIAVHRAWVERARKTLARYEVKADPHGRV